MALAPLVTKYSNLNEAKPPAHRNPRFIYQVYNSTIYLLFSIFLQYINIPYIYIQQYKIQYTVINACINILLKNI